MLRNWWLPLNFRRNRPARGSAPRRPALCRLESREVPAFVANIVNNTLTVTLGGAATTFQSEDVGGTLQLKIADGDATQSFKYADFTSLSVLGTDTVSQSATFTGTLPITLGEGSIGVSGVDTITVDDGLSLTGATGFSLSANDRITVAATAVIATNENALLTGVGSEFLGTVIDALGTFNLAPGKIVSVTGSTKDDTITLQPQTAPFTVNGGTGNDTVTVIVAPADVVTPTAAGLTVGSFGQILANDVESIRVTNAAMSYTVGGSSGGDSFLAFRDASRFLVQLGGSQSVELVGATSVTFQGGEGDDTLNYQVPAEGPAIDFQAGTGFGDAIRLDNGGGVASFLSVRHDFTNATDGQVTFTQAEGKSSHAITYTGLDPILDNLNADDRVFVFAAATKAITVSDADPVNTGATKIESDASETVVFANPNVSLTILAGAGDNTISVASVDENYRASLFIDGEAGNEVIVQTGPLTLGSATSKGDLTYTADAIQLGADISTDGADAAGTPVFNGPVTLVGDMTIDTDAKTTDAAVTFTDTLDGAKALTVVAGAADVNFTGKVGDSTALGALTISSAKNVTFNSVKVTGALTQTAGSGSTAFNAAATVGSAAVTTATITFTGGSITAAGSTVSLTASGAVVADNATTDVTAKALTVSAGAGGVGTSADPLRTDVTNLAVTTTGSGNASVRETDGVNLNSADVGGNFTLVTSGPITDSGSVVVTGAAIIDANSQDITLGDDAAATTNFGTLQFIGGAVAINEDSDTKLTGVNTAGSLKLTSAGAITDAAGTKLNVTNNVSFSGTSIDLGGDDSLNFGSLTFTSTGSVTITEASDTVLSGTNTAGSLTLTSAGTITEDADADLAVTGNASFNGTAITLGDAANNDVNFGSLTFASTGAVVVTEDSATQLSGINSAATLNLTSAAAITDAAGTKLDVTNNANFNGGLITLGGDDTLNFGSLTFASAGSVAITEASAAQIVGVNSAKSLALTAAGAITDSASTKLAVTDNASFNGTSVTLGGDDTLTFGSLSFTSTGAVSVIESDGTVLSGVNTAGSLTLTSFAAITDAAGTELTVTGNANFSGTSIVLGGDDTLAFGTLTFSSNGAVAVTETGDTKLAGTSTANSLNLTSTGAITAESAAKLTVTTNASFAGTSINLTNITDNFGSLTFNSAGDVAFNLDTLAVIEGVNTAGTLSLTAAGAITDAAGTKIAVTKDAAFAATGNPITLGDTGTDSLTIGGELRFNAAAVTITAKSALALALGSTGTTVLLTAGGAITDGTVILGAPVTIHIAATNLYLNAVGGIGSLANPILTQVATLDLDNATSGGAFVTNTGKLTLDQVSGSLTSTIVGGGRIVAQSPLVINTPQIVSGPTDFVAGNGNVDGGDDLTIAADVTHSDAGPLRFLAGDDILHTAGTVTGGKNAEVHFLADQDGTADTDVTIGGINQTGGKLVADFALFESGADVVYTQAANDVGTVAATVTAGGFFFIDAGDVTVGTVNAVNGITTTKDVALVSVGGAIAVNNVITAAGQTVHLQAKTGITQTGVITAANVGAVNTASGAIALDAANAVGLFAAKNSASGAPINFTSAAAKLTVGEVAKVDGLFDGASGVLSTNGRITLTADDFAVAKAITAGTEGACLQPFAAGTKIFFDAADQAGLSLSQTELDLITGKVIEVGQTTAGAIAVQQAISVTKLSLVTGNDITQTAAITATTLAARAGGSVTLTNAANDVGTIAGSVGNNQRFQFTNAKPLTVGTVNVCDGTVSGITATGNAGVGKCQIVLTAPDVTIAAAITGHSLELVTANPVALGAAVAGSLSLVQAELDFLTLTNALVLDSADTITLKGAVTLDVAKVPVLALRTTKSAQTDGGSVAVGQLAVKATEAILLTGANNISTVALAAGANATVNNGTNKLTIGTVTVCGVATGDNTGEIITITADDLEIATKIVATKCVIIQVASADRGVDLGTETAGQLSLTDAELDFITAPVLQINSGTAGTLTSAPVTLANAFVPTLDLRTTGDVTGGGITVTNLHSKAAGDVLLTTANNVTNLAGSANAKFRFVDADDVAVETFAVCMETGTDVTLTGTGDVLIVSNTGAIAVNEPINAAGSVVRLQAKTGITQEADGQIFAADLGVRSTAGDIALSKAENDVTGQFAAVNGADDVFFFNKSAAATLTVGKVLAVNGLFDEVDGVSIVAAQDFLLHNTKAIAIDRPISAAGATVRLVASGGVSQLTTGTVKAANLGVRNTGTGNIDLAGDRVSSAAVDNVVSVFAADNAAANAAVHLRTTVDLTVDTVAALKADLADFAATDGVVSDTGDTGSVLLISTGKIAIAKAVDTKAVAGGTVRIEAVNGVTQAATGVITTGTLGVRNTSQNNIALATANNNVVSTFTAVNAATSATGGDIFFHNESATTLNIGSVTAVPQLFAAIDGVSVNTPQNGVLIDTANALTIAAPVSAAGDAVRLVAVGGVSQTKAGPITAELLGVRNAGNGDIQLATDANVLVANAVNNFAANNAAAGTIDFHSDNAFAVGTAAALTKDLASFAETAGVTSSNQDVLLSSANAITLKAAVNAGTGTVRLKASTGIGQDAAGIVTAAALGARTDAGDVLLIQANNAVSTFAATAPVTVTFNSTKAYTVGAVAERMVNGKLLFTATSGATTADAGTIYLKGNSDVMLAQAVNAGAAGTVVIETKTNVTQADKGTVTAKNLGVRATGNALLSTLDNAVSTFTATGKTVELHSTLDLTVGSVGPVTADGVTFDQINGVKATVAVLLSSAKSLTLAQPVNGPIVRITADGDVTQAAAGTITATTLGVRSANGKVDLTNAGNAVANFAAFSGAAAGFVQFQTAGDLTVNDVAAEGRFVETKGITATKGTSQITVRTGGTLALDDAVDSAAGAVRFTTGGAVTQQNLGVVTAAELGVRAAGGDIVLSLANAVDEFAAFAGGDGSSVVFRSAINLKVGAVGAVGGLFEATTGVVNTTGSTAAVLTSSGSITVDQPIVTGTLGLDSSGGVTQSEAGTLNATAVGVRNTGAGAVTLDSANVVIIFAASSTFAGAAISFTSAAVPLTVTQVEQNTAAAKLAFANLSDVTTNNGRVTLTADDLELLQQINAGTAEVCLRPLSAARPITLGGAAAGTFSLTDAELNQVTAGVLEVGRANAGPVAIAGVVTLNAKATTLSLVGGVGIVEVAGGRVTVLNLAVQAGAGSVVLTGANQVTTLAGRATGQFLFNDTDGFAIGTVGTCDGPLAGITVDGTPPSGECALLIVADDLEITQPIVADSVEIRTASNTRAISLGELASDSLVLTDAELDLISAVNGLIIGSSSQVTAGAADAGPITIRKAITLDAAKVVALELRSADSVRATAAGTIQVGDLAVRVTNSSAGAGVVDLPNNNSVGELAVAANGDVTFKNGAGLHLTIGTVTVCGVSLSGINSAGNDVTLFADDTAVQEPINAGVSGCVIFAPTTNDRTILLGSGRDGAFGLSDAEIDRITARVLQIGTGDTTGAVELTSAVTLANGQVPTLDLRTAAAATSVGSAGTLMVTNFAAKVGSLAFTNVNTITTIAAETTSGGYSLTNGTNLTVGTVVVCDTTRVGLASKGDVTLVVTGKLFLGSGVGEDLTANSGSDTVTSTVTLDASGGVDERPGSIIAAPNLLLLGGGDFNLTQANQVGKLAANVGAKAPGDLSFTDVEGGLTVGTINGTAGITVAGDNTLTLTTSGLITIAANAPVTVTGNASVVRFDSQGGVALDNTAGNTSVITANLLQLLGRGNFQLARFDNTTTLSANNNDVNILTANLTGDGSIFFSDLDDLTINTDFANSASQVKNRPGVNTTGGDVVLYLGGDFTADVGNAQSGTVTLFDTQGKGAVQVYFGSSVGGKTAQAEGTVIYNAEVNASVLSIGSPRVNEANGPSGFTTPAAFLLNREISPTSGGSVGEIDILIPDAFANTGNDTFTIRPSSSTPIVVFGNTPEDFPGDTIFLQTEGITPDGFKAEGPRNGRFFFQNAQDVVYRNIERTQGFSLVAFSFQTGPRDFQIVASGSLNGKAFASQARFDLPRPVPFIAGPSFANATGLPFAAPEITVGDFNGDNVPDLIVSLGADNAPLVTVINGNRVTTSVAVDSNTLGNTQAQNGATLAAVDILATFYAYTPAFFGGVYVAAGNIDGSSDKTGQVEIITGAGEGGGPHVRVFGLRDVPSGAVGFTLNSLGEKVFVTSNLSSGSFFPLGSQTELPFGTVVRDLSELVVERFGFFAYDPRFTGGVRVAAGDTNRDGITDIFTAAGPGGGPHVRVFDTNLFINPGNINPQNGTFIKMPDIFNFFPYDQRFTGGVYIGAGDYDGNGVTDLVTGPGFGGGAHVKLFTNNNYSKANLEFLAFAPDANTLPQDFARASLSGVSGVAIGSIGDAVVSEDGQTVTVNANSSTQAAILVSAGRTQPNEVRGFYRAVLDNPAALAMLPRSGAFAPNLPGSNSLLNLLVQDDFLRSFRDGIRVAAATDLGTGTP